ncbi:leucyl aminopeptidase [Candidatus Pelagibacter sp.]|nr:leucyl aminopeptidase [Candidatus Pelagibacter sp.]
MTVQVNYKNKIIANSAGNYAFFTDEKLKIKNLKNTFSNQEISFISEIIKKKSTKKSFVSFDLSSKKRIILIPIKENLENVQIEHLGANFYNYIQENSINDISINLDSLKIKPFKDYLGCFLHGLKLRSYDFNIYKSKKEKKNYIINILGKKNNSFSKNELKFKALEDGLKFTKDLVSEPGNILHPDEYTKRLNLLKKIGLKINVYNEKKLKKLGMNALLGVGQGSIRGSYLVTLEWNGLKNKTKPLAFVGKGVCFDTGGISLKPAKFMEDMTYDMAGSAVVAGLMKNLALKKAKINAVGVVGLVENMPGGNAQRPGDIVKSYSKKTIEILNTDAEGRLVLADALTFTERKFKPKFIIDLATLTGAIIVSLGSEYAGLFSNDDKLSKQIFNAGNKVEEKVWRMPLHKNYDKLIDSKNADMQNINYVGGAGSTTAAQFLQRFILNKTPWAHLDIAGMAFSKYGGSLNSRGATGFGVRLLNKLIEDEYE